MDKYSGLGYGLNAERERKKMKRDPLFNVCMERGTNPRKREAKKFERDGKSLVLDNIDLEMIMEYFTRMFNRNLKN